MSHFAVLPRQFSILVYGEHPVAYEASCQVDVVGDRGFMHSITGVHFYDHWRKPGEVDLLLEACGVKTLEGYAVSSHARLMAISLRGVAKVSLGAKGIMAGREMVWCIVSSLRTTITDNYKEPNVQFLHKF